MDNEVITINDEPVSVSNSDKHTVDEELQTRRTVDEELQTRHTVHEELRIQREMLIVLSKRMEEIERNLNLRSNDAIHFRSPMQTIPQHALFSFSNGNQAGTGKRAKKPSEKQLAYSASREPVKVGSVNGSSSNKKSAPRTKPATKTNSKSASRTQSKTKEVNEDEMEEEEEESEEEDEWNEEDIKKASKETYEHMEKILRRQKIYVVIDPASTDLNEAEIPGNLFGKVIAMKWEDGWAHGVLSKITHSGERKRFNIKCNFYDRETGTVKDKSYYPIKISMDKYNGSEDAPVGSWALIGIDETV